jgi:phage terminase large subunit-like protein
MAMHLTGQYPADWQGRRWERPIAAWCGGPGGQAVRDTVQRVLMGNIGEFGTGMIPGSDIVDVSMARGVPDAVESVRVRNANTGTSRLTFKSYEQGRQKWQGETLDYIWLDEEPPLDIYTEALSRTNATGGIVAITFTPLLGVSDVVIRFLKERSPDRHDTVMTIDDAEHIPPEERARIIASYPAHERDARTRGVPALGSGRVFPFPRDMIAVEAFKIPSHWALIGGIDFGWDHPTAAVRLAHERDTDTVYVTECYRVGEQVPVVHAGALRPWGKIPWAWPHDGLQHDKTSGEQLAELYRKNGLDMIFERAKFSDDRGSGVEAGLIEMADRMQTNRWKVFSHLNDWFEEFDLYHRKDGIVVKMRDDLISASRYGMMMLRHARAGAAPKDRYAAGRPRRSGSWMAA